MFVLNWPSTWNAWYWYIKTKSFNILFWSPSKFQLEVWVALTKRTWTPKIDDNVFKHNSSQKRKRQIEECRGGNHNKRPLIAADILKTQMQFLIMDIDKNILLSIGLTCIPPTSVFRPTLSKGLTAGFAPMPIITCKAERKINFYPLNFSFLSSVDVIPLCFIY